MPTGIGQFRNAILCEDVREEIRNKKSLMGVFTGDVVVSEFPARIRMAIYLEYAPIKGEGQHIIEIVLMRDEDEIARATASVDDDSKPRSIILPQGILLLEQGGDLVVRANVGEVSTEVLRKSVQLGEVKNTP